MTRILVSHRQLGLGLPEPEVRAARPGRGGKRVGAGRKRAFPERRPNVPHVSRPEVDPSSPKHVTLRAVHEVAFLRDELVFARVKHALAVAAAVEDARAEAKGDAERAAFRVVAFSVQRDHVHLLIEADSLVALRSGMQGLTTRLARAINGALRRRGRVWGDRYHRRDLTRPTEARNALVYVLQNHRKHGVGPRVGLDPCSSAALFLGWNDRGEALRRRLPGSGIDRTPAIHLPRTWLLRVGWCERGGGLIDPREAPRSG